MSWTIFKTEFTRFYHLAYQAQLIERIPTGKIQTDNHEVYNTNKQKTSTVVGIHGKKEA